VSASSEAAMTEIRAFNREVEEERQQRDEKRGVSFLRGQLVLLAQTNVGLRNELSERAESAWENAVEKNDMFEDECVDVLKGLIRIELRKQEELLQLERSLAKQHGWDEEDAAMEMDEAGNRQWLRDEGIVIVDDESFEPWDAVTDFLLELEPGDTVRVEDIPARVGTEFSVEANEEIVSDCLSSEDGFFTVEDGIVRRTAKPTDAERLRALLTLQEEGA
jgi:hypothetical protein